LQINQKQIKTAKSKHADIVHFSECSLSGYAGWAFHHYKEQDEIELHESLDKIKKDLRKAVCNYLFQ